MDTKRNRDDDSSRWHGPHWVDHLLEDLPPGSHGWARELEADFPDAAPEWLQRCYDDFDPDTPEWYRTLEIRLNLFIESHFGAFERHPVLLVSTAVLAFLLVTLGPFVPLVLVADQHFSGSLGWKSWCVAFVCVSLLWLLAYRWCYWIRLAYGTGPKRPQFVRLLFFLWVLCPLAPGLILNLNVRLDGSPPKPYVVTILEKEITEDGEYRIVYTSWQAPHERTYHFLTAEQYEPLRVNRKAKIYVRAGYFNAPWFHDIQPNKKAPHE